MKQRILEFTLSFVMFLSVYLALDIVGALLYAIRTTDPKTQWPILLIGGTIYALASIYLKPTLPIREKKGGVKPDTSEAKPETKTMLSASPACAVCGKRLRLAAGVCPCGALVCAWGDCWERHEAIGHDGDVHK